MLAGIRPITKGSIKLLIDKKPLNKRLNNLHKHIAYMPQNPVFHTITIKDYIRDGDPKLNNKRLKKIVRELKIAETFGISFNKIFDLVIGPKGYSPSGGQSKLLALARTLYKKNVYLYLLDEPTTGLSKELKKIVLNTINNLAIESFIFCITHDLKEIKPNDQILNL